MHDAVLIFPHQLFKVHPAVTPERIVYLIEEPLYFSQYKFHKQKIILHRASMKAYETMLRNSGRTVRYIEHAELQSKTIASILREDGMTMVHIADVVDDWLNKRIVQGMKEQGIDIHWYETPQFLTSDKDARAYWHGRKRHLQHDFYVWQRKRLQVLVEHDQPVGGIWSFDAENRKPLPKKFSIPEIPTVAHNAFVTEATAYTETHFSDHYGDAQPFSYAVTHADAEECLQQFLHERLDTFGPYEDAMTTRSHTLFHSVLTPYLNNGLLLPREVLSAVLHYAAENPVPIASLEGFVRQLIGWREFIRMVYVCEGARMRKKNTLQATRKLTSAWWDGTTGIVPIDDAIRTLKHVAYTHHIMRLMVVGNFMTLLGIDPDEGYQWFMEWYIDAYDWVMVPNVYGMALFADGGTMVTKPYVSSSNYLRKMSDYMKGEWTGIWDALYWAFVEKHQALLSANKRASFSVSMFNRFSEDKKEAFRNAAHKAIQTLTA